METVNVGSFTPFFFKACVDWVNTFGTPYIRVLADGIQGDDISDVVDNTGDFGVVVLNISDRATGGIQYQENGINCSMRFKGVSRTIFIDYRLIMTVFDQATGIGSVLIEPMALTKDNVVLIVKDVLDDSLATGKPGRPKLRVVK